MRTRPPLISNGLRPFTVHSGSGTFSPVNYRDDPGGDEGVDWIRGHHASDSSALNAVRAALILRDPGVWTTADKRVMRVVDMDDTHLINAIKKFSRKTVTLERGREYASIVAEAKRRNLEIPT